MSLSNYPPGVSGNEDQIAGPYLERTETKTCEEENVSVTVVRSNALSLIQGALGALPLADDPGVTTAAMRQSFQRLLESLKDGLGTHEMWRCLFVGDVDVSYWRGSGSMTWTCPVCGTDYEEPTPRDDDGDAVERGAF